MSLRIMTLALATALALLGCSESLSGKSCTEIGCGSAFSVEFADAGEWASGSYAVVVDVDGKTFPCALALPLSCDAPSPCGATAPFVLGLSGCALDPSQQSLSGVEFVQGEAPATIRVEVSHDGQPLGEGTFHPTYATSRPNGDDCEPVCKSAPAATLSLD